MQLDSEFSGLLVAVGFLVMGLVSMPLATGFVLGAIALGVFVNGGLCGRVFEPLEIRQRHR